MERVPPFVDDENRPFWKAGRDGVLCFQACLACGAQVAVVTSGGLTAAGAMRLRSAS